MTSDTRQQKRSISILAQVTLSLFLVFIIAWVWKGNPNTIQAFNTNGFSIVGRNLYYLLYFAMLFSFSRTISLRTLFLFFFLGATVTSAVGIFLQKWVLHWNLILYSSVLGSWNDPGSVYHASITGPVIEEMLKIVPVAVYFAIRRKRGDLASHSISDWFLLALASGLGFTVGEDLIRLQKNAFFFGTGLDWSWPNQWYDLLIPISGAKEGKFSFFSKEFNFISASHAFWAAVPGLALGFVSKKSLQSKLKPVFLWSVPLLVLLWASMEHGLSNLTLRPLYSEIQQFWLTKVFLTLSLGGRLFVLVCIIAIFGLLVYEFRLLNKENKWEWWKKMRWDSDFFKTFLNEMIRQRKTIQVKGRLGRFFYFVAFYWFVLNAILEYIASRFTLARMKHALFWRASHGRM